MDTTVISNNPIVRLLNSSKAIVVLVVIAGGFIAFAFGKASWEQVEGMLRWVVSVWLGAQGLEDAAKHYATRSNTSTAGLVGEVVRAAVKDSLTPPPPAGNASVVVNMPQTAPVPSIDERPVVGVRE